TKSAMMMAAQLLGDSLAVAAIIPSSSLRQTILPGELLGRTAAMFRAGGGARRVRGGLFGGLVADGRGGRTALVLARFGLLGCALIGLFSPLIRLKEMPEAAT